MFKLFDRIEEIVAVALLAGTSTAVLIGAVGRSIGIPIPSAPEIAQLLLIWAVMLGADLMIKRGEHIRISALPDALSPGWHRLLNFTCLVFIIGFLIYCGWLGWVLAMSNWARPMGASGFSYGWVTLALPVGCALMLLSLLRRTISHGVLHSIESETRGQEKLL